MAMLLGVLAVMLVSVMLAMWAVPSRVPARPRRSPTLPPMRSEAMAVPPPVTREAHRVGREVEALRQVLRERDLRPGPAAWPATDFADTVVEQHRAQGSRAPAPVGVTWSPPERRDDVRITLKF